MGLGQCYICPGLGWLLAGSFRGHPQDLPYFPERPPLFKNFSKIGVCGTQLTFSTVPEDIHSLSVGHMSHLTGHLNVG